MIRLLIVDDEEIITDTLFEVFSQSNIDELDICKAYSANEALSWLSRTRIDIVLCDIRMPGMSGIELMEEIKTYWPRCGIIFLTGYSEFEYAYQAIQRSNVKYLLKTEGYDKVIATVKQVIEEISHDHQMNNLVKQSEEQQHTLRYVAQEDFFRAYMLGSSSDRSNYNQLKDDFDRLQIKLLPDKPILMVLGHLSYGVDRSYLEKSEVLTTVKYIWHSFMDNHVNSAVMIDKQGDLLWLLQSSAEDDEKFINHLHTFVEGTLELIQQACFESLEIGLSFTMSGEHTAWNGLTNQYDRLRQLQRMRIRDDIPLIQIDHVRGAEIPSAPDVIRIGPKIEVLSVHLDAGRAEDFFLCLKEIESYTLSKNNYVYRAMEIYYAVALVLLSHLNKYHLHDEIKEMNKLMRLDEHISMKEGFRYLHEIAESIFANKRNDERDRASLIIEKICKYIQGHLSEDLSLVRLAEIHYFNPSYLSRFFKQERGVKLSEFIDECRVRKAKELLSNGELKIRDVSLLVGYEAAHSFTRFFKKTTGMTPQEYRDMLITEK